MQIQENVTQEHLTHFDTNILVLKRNNNIERVDTSHKDT